jgi:hypothetical protein
MRCQTSLPPGETSAHDGKSLVWKTRNPGIAVANGYMFGQTDREKTMPDAIKEERAWILNAPTAGINS